MWYGQAAMGVSDSHLLAQRRTAAVACSPASGAGGQNLDLALILADGGRRSIADPAFPAHLQPIGEWATAVWENWLPVSALHRMVFDAKKRLAKARSVWSVCYGPAAAVVATCARLNWNVLDATAIKTDDGKVLHLNLDPPVVVMQEVKKAVRRWRWRSIERTLSDLGANGSGRGAPMEPIWKLLMSNRNDKDWNPSLRGALRSIIANRQWPQSRVHASGWSKHDKCNVCLNDVIVSVSVRMNEMNGRNGLMAKASSLHKRLICLGRPASSSCSACRAEF